MQCLRYISSSNLGLHSLTMAKAKSRINAKTINQFMNPDEIPEDIEDRILEVYAKYSIDTDLTTRELHNFLNDLGISGVFIVNNRELRPEELTIEGTDIIDFDQLLNKCYHLIMFQQNKELLIHTWNLLRYLMPNKTKHTLNFADLKSISDDIKSGINEKVLLDMIAVATEGESVEVNFIDFAYIMGKMGELAE